MFFSHIDVSLSLSFSLSLSSFPSLLNENKINLKKKEGTTSEWWTFLQVAKRKAHIPGPS